MKLPRVDAILAHPDLAAHPAAYALKKRAVQQRLAVMRAARLVEKEDVPEDMSMATAAVAREVAAALDELLVSRPRAVINATGVLLHTNLGRAPLAAEAVAAMVAAAGCCELEIEVVSGRRGSRLVWLRPSSVWRWWRMPWFYSSFCDCIFFVGQCKLLRIFPKVE